MAIIKKEKISSVQEDIEKLELSYISWWEYKMVQAVWKTIWQFLRKLKHIRPSNSTPRYPPKRNKM